MTDWKHLSQLLTCAAVAVLSPATGAVAQDAKREINLYSSLTESLIEHISNAFEQAHPEYDVVPLRLVSGALATRVYNEASVGLNQADVVVTAASDLFMDNPQWFADLSGSPAYQAWPDDLKQPSHVKALFQVLSIYYNTNNVTAEQAPKTWEDLADPRWQGKAVMLDPSASSTYLSWALNMRKAFGDDYLAALQALNPTIAGGVLDAAQMVASGAADIGFPAAPNSAATLRADGAPIEIVYVDAPTLGNETSIAIPAVSPNPEGARVFFEWFLSKDGGLPFACLEGQSSGMRDVPGCAALPSDFVPMTFGVPAEEAEELISLLLP